MKVPREKPFWHCARKHVNPAVFTFYSDPLMIVEGHRQYVYDEKGRRYLDLFAGIATVSCGHSHPKILARIREQASRLQHASTIYLHPSMGQLAEKLVGKLPAGLRYRLFHQQWK